MIQIGFNVTPKTKAGLQLADVPTNGVYLQDRKVVCVFVGTGKVIDVYDVVIDYDSWAPEYNGVGKIAYRSCLIQCDNGIGWGGEGALLTI